mgnify:CR=1 FL=1
MALIKSIKGLTPKWGRECYFSENATIVGEVTMGDECSVWFNAVVRGDVAPITMGNAVNVQDGACIHVTNTTGPTVIGNNVSIGHNATVHACTIRDGALVGMGATLRGWRGGCGGCRRSRPSGHEDRRARDMGRCSGQVYQEDITRTGRELRCPLCGVFEVVSGGRRKRGKR